MKKKSDQRIIIWLACLTLAACSQRTAENANGNRGSASAPTTAASASPTSSPTPEVEQLKIPERVASGAVTESRGTWNKVVQSINYVSTADNTPADDVLQAASGRPETAASGLAFVEQ